MRRSSRLDFVKREVVIPNYGVFPLSGIASTLHPGLALIGLKHVLLAAPQMDEIYSGLQQGEMPKFREPSGPKMDAWQEAMALACAEQKAAVELGPRAKAQAVAQAAAGYLAEMREHVAGLAKETLKTMRAHPAVIQHHRQLTGPGGDQLSLLAIAGVTSGREALPLAPEIERPPAPAPVPETAASF